MPRSSSFIQGNIEFQGRFSYWISSLLSDCRFYTSKLNEWKLNCVLREIEQENSLKLLDEDDEVKARNVPEGHHVTSVEISHPWPEWVNLMEVLLKKSYLDADVHSAGQRDHSRIRSACLNFARDRVNLIRYFSRQDIQLVAGCGCPSLDRKVVNSGKRLRAYVGIEEGNVCSSCNLRGHCERAYIKVPEGKIGRTVDVMRMLVTYGLDNVTKYVENMQCCNRKIKDSVRRLLDQMVYFSEKDLDSSPLAVTSGHVRSSSETPAAKLPTKQGDWICPKCKFFNFAKNIRCLRCEGLFQDRLQQLWTTQDHLPMKRGDWVCDKCNFLNFAKNTKCLQCKEKPSNRPLNPGEWECDSCNYVNFRKNAFCLKCGWKWPKASSHTIKKILPQDLCSQPILELVRDDGGSRHRDSHLGTCGENAIRKHTLNHETFLENFPIVGGNSAVSRNFQGVETWKKNMARSCEPLQMSETGGSDHMRYQKIEEVLGVDIHSDNEMAEWFGYKGRSQN